MSRIETLSRTPAFTKYASDQSRAYAKVLLAEAADLYAQSKADLYVMQIRAARLAQARANARCAFAVLRAAQEMK